MHEGVFQFRLPAGERRRILEVLNAFGAIGLNDDELKTAAACRGTSFAPDEGALPFVEPDHGNQPLRRGQA